MMIAWYILCGLVVGIATLVAIAVGEAYSSRNDSHFWKRERGKGE